MALGTGLALLIRRSGVAPVRDITDWSHPRKSANAR